MNKQRMRKKDVMFIHRVELNFPGRIPNVVGCPQNALKLVHLSFQKISTAVK